ncbi:hypothetical protein [Paraliomyxa miuraensis]|uniref:hypothetical protein n=1 Tax=Paraliomyxa miuraensis TaxID=376150 RepID=UPI002254D0DD|nr:hypothetical protein [Paraliomyxa miuraensis]MCX4246057.1 hypothetical protein [Paraliomyxa miuraensis]
MVSWRMGIEELRARLMASLAVALGAGCGPVVQLPDDGGGDGGSSSVGSTTGGSSSGASATSSAETSTGGVDEGAESETGPMQPKFDFGGVPPIPPMPPPDCPSQPRPPAEACMAELPEGSYFQFYCVELFEGQTCDEWARGFAGSAKLNEDLAACYGEGCQQVEASAIGCGPLPDFGDQCCMWFIVQSWPCPPEGRPFVIDGRERLAALVEVERDDWGGVTRVAMPSDHRAALAAAWADVALAEHASIASFSRFILQLMACGAPASLVTAAHVALGEEIEHARLFFALASGAAGRPLGPGALDVRDALAGSDDLDEIVLATVREGCIAETLSAWRITVAARLAREPALAAALARVAEQELEHAALAWRFVAWALPRASASLRRRIETTLRAPAEHAPRGADLPAEVPDEVWRAHGILPPADVDATTQHALRELVAPLARALLGGRSLGAVGLPMHQ